MDVPWLIVAGFGAHIKSTRKSLVVQKDGSIEEYPLRSVHHLLVVGGHTIHSNVIANMLKAGGKVSFFEADGRPLGIIRPGFDREEINLSILQKDAPHYRYAIAIARASMRSKTLYLGEIGDTTGKDLFYEGELQIFLKSLEELEFLIKISEVRRIHRLTTDMYFEVLSRALPPEFEFRRRTDRPYGDPVNAVLAFGYSMLFGNVLFSLVGAGLDPEVGMMHRGQFALVYDVMEPFKTEMIDKPAVNYIREELRQEDYECSPTRCILSDPCIKRFIQLFHGTIDQASIDRQVLSLRHSLEEKTGFTIER